MAAIQADDVPFDPQRKYLAEYPPKRPLLATQPFKLIYSTWAILFNSIQFPLWILAFLIPRFRPNPNWSLQTAVVNQIVAKSLTVMGTVGAITPLSLAPGFEGKRLEVVAPTRKNAYVDICVDPRGAVKPVSLPGTWTPAVPAAGAANKRTILHFHGGAFVIGDVRTLYSGHVNRVLSRYVAPQVVAAGYRLSSNPDGYFPAQLQDAVTWWFHLTDDLAIDPSNIVLSGDSAGANLAYQLLRYMELHRDLFPTLPAAVLQWSPWVDLATGFHADEIPAAPSYKTDYIVPGFPQWGATTMCVNYPATDPWLSPVRGVFKTQVPVFIQTGSSEILFNDITLFHKKLVAAGVPVELHISEHANHDIILLGRLMGFSKETKAACDHASKWLDKIFAGKTKA